MAHTLGELARLVDGTVHGDPHQPITGASPIMTAAAGELTMIDKPERLKKLAGTRAAAFVATTAVVEACGASLPLAVIEVADAHAAFTKIVAAFRPQRTATSVGISAAAVISSSAKIGPDCEIHPLATIGDDVEIEAGCVIHSGVRILAGSKIGEGTTIYPNAVLYENTLVGARSIIHAGAVLGAYGFGYKQFAGKHVLTSQLGNVELGSDVEIGANTTIDRGTYGPTRIGDGTKLDDQVMIGHNCVLGKHNLICSQVGIAGSTSTGDYVVMGRPSRPPRSHSHRRSGRARCDERRDERRRRRQHDARYSRHAGARSDADSRHRAEAARDAQATQGAGKSDRPASSLAGNANASGRRPSGCLDR